MVKRGLRGRTPQAGARANRGSSPSAPPPGTKSTAARGRGLPPTRGDEIDLAIRHGSGPPTSHPHMPRTAWVARSVCHSTSRLSASDRRPASVIATQITVIRRVLVHIVPGWIAASPSRASRSSNAFVKPWANMSATVRPCGASASSLSARCCWTLVVKRAPIEWVRFKVMRLLLSIRESREAWHMAAAKLSDEAFSAILEAHPGLRERFASIAMAVANSGENLKEADAIEERIVEEMRLLGREAMQGWAETQVKATEKEIRQQPSMHRQGKKNSAGIRNLAKSRF